MAEINQASSMRDTSGKLGDKLTDHPVVVRPRFHEFSQSHALQGDAPALMGGSDWYPRTWMQLWEVKMGLSQVPTFPRMRRQENELPEALRASRDHLNCSSGPLRLSRGFLATDIVGRLGKELSAVQIVMLDGLRKQKDIEALGGVHPHMSNEELRAILPQSIWWSAQHSILVTGHRAVTLFIWSSDVEPKVITVLLNEECQRELETRWLAFWPHVENRTCPPASALDVVFRTDSAFVDRANEWKASLARRGESHSETRKAKDALIDLTYDFYIFEAVGVRVDRTYRHGGTPQGSESVGRDGGQAAIEWEAACDVMLVG